MKKKCSALVKLLATGAACLSFVPWVTAQTPMRDGSGDYSNQLRPVPNGAASNGTVTNGQMTNGPMSNNTTPSRLQPTTRTNVAARSPNAAPARTFVPTHLRSSGVMQSSYAANQNILDGEMIMEGETIIGGESMMGQPVYDGGCNDCGGGLGCEVGCDSGCGYGDGCDPCGYNRYPPVFSLSDMEYFAGAQGFKGSLNLGEGGSFGFNEGINWGFPLPLFTGLGLSGQLGVRAIQANGNGAGFTTQTRNQTFVTAGAFRRVDYGLQVGVVYDYLNEDWYFNSNFGQVRGEIGWVGAYGNLLGFRFTSGTNKGPDVNQQAEIQQFVNRVKPELSAFNTFVPLDTYRFFYQHHFAQTGAVVEGFGGFSSQSQGLLGADMWVPITDRILLRTNATLLIDDSEGSDANVDEAWNVSAGLVFYPKGWCRWQRAYHRPMFDPADNGTFLFGRQ